MLVLRLFYHLAGIENFTTFVRMHKKYAYIISIVPSNCAKNRFFDLTSV